MIKLGRFEIEMQAIPHDKIAVVVEHGRVTLAGTVDWYHQMNEARKAASRIRGVTGF